MRHVTMILVLTFGAVTAVALAITSLLGVEIVTPFFTAMDPGAGNPMPGKGTITFGAGMAVLGVVGMLSIPGSIILYLMVGRDRRPL